MVGHGNTRRTRAGRQRNQTSHPDTRQSNLFDQDLPDPQANAAPDIDGNPGCIRCRTTYLSVNHVAERYRASPATIWRWVKSDPSFPRLCASAPV